MARLLAAALLLAALAPDARAEDCSAAPAPDGKLVLRIDEQETPLGVAKLRSQQSMTMGDEAFDVFSLSLRDAESIFPPHEVSLSLLVRQGETLEGKTFRRLPIADIQKQPTPVTSPGLWLPEVQSVAVSGESEGIAYEHGVLASLRVEFGKRSGDAQPGRVRLCIARGQTDATLQPEPTRAIVVEGAFEANAAP